MNIHVFRKGFTLLELLVVITVIGILFIIAAVAFNGARIKARDSRRIADMNSVIQGLSEAVEDDVTSFGCDAPSALHACGSGTLDPYVRLSFVKDPFEPTANCSASASASCEYFLTDGPDTPASKTPMNYTIWFYLEKGTAGLQAGPHSATQNGIR